MLKGFGNKGDSSKVYELDKESGIIEVKRVADVASKQKLLTDRDDELMKSIEQRAKDVIGKIRKGSYNITERDRLALDDLVFALILNDPNSGFDEEHTRASVIENVSNDLIEVMSRIGGSVESTIMTNFVGAGLNHDYLSLALDRRDNLALRAFDYMELRAYRPGNGEFFVIGDSPVLIVRGTVDGVNNLFNAGSQIILPIHSRCVLFYTWETSTNVPLSGIVLNRELVRSLNKDYYHGSDSRYVFARGCDVLKEASRPRKHSNAEALFPIKNDGWSIMRPEIIRTSVSRAAKDTEEKRELESVACDVVRKAKIDMQGQTSMDS